MSTSSSSLQKNVARVLLAVCFVSSAALVGLAGKQSGGAVAVGGKIASIEASMMPARLKSGQKPAPVTWSSRFNVRWEARWGGEGKYMV